jgi:hypothetical protein
VVAVLSIVAATMVLGARHAWSAQPAPGDLAVSSAPAAADPGMEAASPGHDLAIEIVRPGREGLELTARLAEDGGLIERNLSWIIRNSDGETVYSAAADTADISVPPGDYAVEIRYGSVSLSSTVTLLAGNRLMVSYVLNAGGLRILPRVRGMGLPASGSEVRVFSLGGRQSGKLVAVSAVPGEVIRVPEGDYRVESRFTAGNARAVTDVHVKAGRMSAVDIDHRAGIARLAFVGAPSADVVWNVADGSGHTVAAAAGLNADVVLVPGTYTARAVVGPDVLSATFQIGSGEARDIILGN